MASASVDVLVVGGGITGAGVARDAAMRGLRVALVERRDFASGTSSRSSKLIHGGVRYLQQGDVGLVLEAAEERRILRRIAPHLTRPRPMMVPAYGLGTHTKLHLGLWTYEKLAGIPEGERHEMLDRRGALEREPGLRPDGLHGAAVYPENLTDDARLVLATIRSAKSAGALIANYAEVVGLSREGSSLAADVNDVERGERLRVSARVVINAAGPWSDSLRKLESTGAKQTLHLTKGIHFVVAAPDLPIRSMVVMQASDKRQLFAVPRGDVVYVGTTDIDFGEAADYPEITREDVDYLIDAVRRVFPAVAWGPERVLAAWAGLRPLIHEEGKRPSEISRKDEVVVGPNGMITVAGGKLTTYRKMAEKVVDLSLSRLGETPRPSTTAEAALDGGDLSVGPEALERSLAERSRLSRPVVERLVLHYGSLAGSLAASAAGDGLLPGGQVLAAEVDRAVDDEMALTLTDVLERRLRLLLFDSSRGLEAAEAVADRMARKLGWSAERRSAEIAKYRRIAAACRPTEEA